MMENEDRDLGVGLLLGGDILFYLLEFRVGEVCEGVWVV